MSQHQPDNLHQLNAFIAQNPSVDLSCADLDLPATLDAMLWPSEAQISHSTLIERLKSYQRLLRLLAGAASPGSAERIAKALLSLGIESALQIVTLGKQRFVSEYQDAFDGDQSLAELVYRRALACKNAVTLEYINLLQHAQNLTAGGEIPGRAVYSPAAYLCELLKLLDEHFVAGSQGFDLHQRREDIQDILLDLTNTQTSLPYLDIVNELLEQQVDRNLDKVYQLLAGRQYPFSLPFSLDHHKLKLYLSHLDLNLAQLHRGYADQTGYLPLAREYLGLSAQALARLFDHSAPIDMVKLQGAYGYQGQGFIAEMSKLPVLLKHTGLQGEQLTELLLQDLQLDACEQHRVAPGREHFYINASNDQNLGYALLCPAQGVVKWYECQTGNITDLSLDWFERFNRFVRLAKQLKMGFTQLDQLLQCCGKDEQQLLFGERTLLNMAHLLYLHQTLSQPLESLILWLNSSECCVEQLASMIDVEVEQLFVLFDLISNDPHIGRFDPQNMFIYQAPRQQQCLAILACGNVAERLWLIEALWILSGWLNKQQISPQTLWQIVNGTARSKAEQQQNEQQQLERFNQLLAGFGGYQLGQQTFESLTSEPTQAFVCWCQWTKTQGSSYKLMVYNRDSLEGFCEFLTQQLPTLEFQPQQLLASLQALGQSQHQYVIEQLAQLLAVEPELVAVLTKAVFNDSPYSHLNWLQPLLSALEPEQEQLQGIDQLVDCYWFELGVKRIEQLILLCRTFGFDAAQLAQGVEQYGLVDRFAEPLLLPSGVDKIDALLETEAHVYVFKDGDFWLYHRDGLQPIDKLDDDPIAQLFEQYQIDQVDGAFVDSQGCWWLICGEVHYLLFPDSQVWQRRDNQFGLVDNGFDHLTHLSSLYLAADGRLFCFNQDQYLAYENFTANGDPVDSGYPKLIEADWGNEHQPITVRPNPNGPMFIGTDDRHYLFNGAEFCCSDTNEWQPVRSFWGKVADDFDHHDFIDGVMVNHQGQPLIFLADKLVKYDASIEQTQLQPVPGYPKLICEEFSGLPCKFTNGIDAALQGLDGKGYLFKANEFLSLAQGQVLTLNEHWGLVNNPIANQGRVDGAFVGLDGRSYLFSGGTYVRYSHEQSGYDLVDDGYPRSISEDWQGLKEITGAVVLAPFTYVFGRQANGERAYLRYQGDGYEQTGQLFTDDDLWCLPLELGQPTIDAPMHAHHGKLYLFFGEHFIEHDYHNQSWGEPVCWRQRWGKAAAKLGPVKAAFAGKDGKSYVFYHQQYLRFSDPELKTPDSGYPRSICRYWGKVENNIANRGKLDAALVYGELTYLFSGDQLFRYRGGQYDYVELGYPRALSRLNQEPGFAGLDMAPFSTGIDGAFADRRQVYLFKASQFVVFNTDQTALGLEYLPLLPELGSVEAIVAEQGHCYSLSQQTWRRWGPLASEVLTTTPAEPPLLAQLPAEFGPVSAVLCGAQDHHYVFAAEQCYDMALGLSFKTTELWGRSCNPIQGQQQIDAAFVGRDGITYVFSRGWFVQYDAGAAKLGYAGQKVMHPPRRISEYWPGMEQVAVAYVWQQYSYLFSPPDQAGHFHCLRYSTDHYAQPDSGYPRSLSFSHWQIPVHLLDDDCCSNFSQIDCIFALGDQLIFISDQQFISLDLGCEHWSAPRPLTLLYPELPFNTSDFTGLTGGFIGADGKAYFFNHHRYVMIDGNHEIKDIKADWGLVDNIFATKVDAAFVAPDGSDYLFSGGEYVRYSRNNGAVDHRFIDEGYPKSIARDLAQEPAFSTMSKALQQAFNQLELEAAEVFIKGIVDHGRCWYCFSGGSLFANDRADYGVYPLAGLGRVGNRFTQGEPVDAAFVNDDLAQTYLFSGDQYIRYSQHYDLIDAGYPKTIKQGLAGDLGIEDLGSAKLDLYQGIDAAVYLSGVGVILVKNRHYLLIGQQQVREGHIDELFGVIDNRFSQSNGVDGAFIDSVGALHLFKDQQTIRYSDLGALKDQQHGFVDRYYPQNTAQQWPHITTKLDGVFTLGHKLYFHYQGKLVSYLPDLSDSFEQRPQEVLAYRWGQWSALRLIEIMTWVGGCAFEPLGDEYKPLAQALFAPNGNYAAAAKAAYALLTQTNPQIKWLLDQQLDQAINEAKRDVLVPYVIATHPEAELDDGDELYQYLLIDVQMNGKTQTTPIGEAIAAVQLYWQRYFLNLEMPHQAPEQSGLRHQLSEFWHWMQHYRSWQTRRKMQLYPENYLLDYPRANQTPGFVAAQQALDSGALTPEHIKGIFLDYMRHYSEVSQLFIEAAHLYEQDGQQHLLLVGRNRTQPTKYHYRFGRLQPLGSEEIVWQPWLLLPLGFEAKQIQCVFAFERVFVFWNENNQLHYAFSRADNSWTAPQSLSCALDGLEGLFVTTQPGVIDITLAFATTADDKRLSHKAYQLNAQLELTPMPTPAAVANGGVVLDQHLYSKKQARVDRQNTLMVSGCEQRTTGLWYVLNDQGGSFLLKPSEVIQKPVGEAAQWPLKLTDWLPGLHGGAVVAAVQPCIDGDSYLFLDNHHYVTWDGHSCTEPVAISTLFGGDNGTEINREQKVDSAFVLDEKICLTLGDKFYQYQGSDQLQLQSTGLLAGAKINIPKHWQRLDGAVGVKKQGYLCFNNPLGEFAAKDQCMPIRSRFGMPYHHPQALSFAAFDSALMFNGVLHLLDANGYRTFSSGECPGVQQPDSKVSTIAGQLFAQDLADSQQQKLYYPDELALGMMLIEDGVWIRSESGLNFIDANAQVKNQAPLPDELVGYWLLADNGCDVSNGEQSPAEANKKAQYLATKNCPLSGATTALTINDAAGRLKIPLNEQLIQSTSVTVELWFKADIEEKPRARHQALVHVGKISRGVGALLYLDRKGYPVFDGDIGVKESHEITAKKPLNDGQWHHLAASYELATKTKSLYVDGQLQGTIELEFDLKKFWLRDILLGARFNSEYFHGQLSEFRIWNVARSERQIQANFRRRLFEYYPEPYDMRDLDWIAGLNYQDHKNRQISIGFYPQPQGCGAKVWIDNKQVKFNGQLEFDTQAPITAALCCNDGKNLIIVIDRCEFQLFHHSQPVKEILAQLVSGFNKKSLELVDLDVYWGERLSQDPVWSNNRVDAAFVNQDKQLYLFSGNQYNRYSADKKGQYAHHPDPGYPSFIYANKEGFPADWDRIDGALTCSKGHRYWFNNKLGLYRRDDDPTGLPISGWGVTNRVDAAYHTDQYIYLICGQSYYRCKHNGGGIGEIEPAHPMGLAKGVSIDAVFSHQSDQPQQRCYYFFSGDHYQRIDDPKCVPSQVRSENFKPINGHWHYWPTALAGGLTGAMSHQLDGKQQLYLFNNYQYGVFSAETVIPREIRDPLLNYRAIRLTASTAERLNRQLYHHGIEGLLTLESQWFNEQPINHLEHSEQHLDFNGANGVYYWELFFHLPLLIGQRLNQAQQFEQAKLWYENVYHPTLGKDCYQFLPLLALEPARLMAELAADIENYSALKPNPIVALAKAQRMLAAKLRPYQRVFHEQVSLGEVEQQLEASQKLINIANWPEAIALNIAVKQLDTQGASRQMLQGLQQQMIATMDNLVELPKRLSLSSYHRALQAQYHNDPANPHYMAALRPKVYQKAVVMAYVDNLIDWGDKLCEQSNREAINEARMLYVLADDVLGLKPQPALITCAPEAKSYAELKQDLDLAKQPRLLQLETELGRWAASYVLSAQDHGLDWNYHGYFYIPVNPQYEHYWDRIEQRLEKLRNMS